MVAMDEERVLEAVEQMAIGQGDRHSIVERYDIASYLDPPRARNDAETEMLITKLIDDGRLVVQGPGKVSLPDDQ
jgi:hypothetical protein